MGTSILIFYLLAAVAVLCRIVLFGFDDELPRPYTTRTCQGRDWLKTFPSSSKQDIRKFLSIFIDAFGFSQQERLKLNPEDQVMEIYKAVYPSMWSPDCFEIATLYMELEANYGISLEGVEDEDLTLGDLFQITQRTHLS